jgi:hypothetical protein
MEPAPGRLGNEGAEGSPEPEPEPEPEPLDDDPGDDPVDGTEGSDGAEGKPEGGVTQTVTPFVLDACTDPPPAGVVALPPPETLPGAGIDGAAGVFTHWVPVGIDVGMDVGIDVGIVGTPGMVGALGSDGSDGSDDGDGSDDRPGTEDTPGTDGVVTALWLAPLGNTLAAAIATAATPAAPPVSLIIRP